MIKFLGKFLPLIMMVLVFLCFLLIIFIMASEAFGYQKVVGDTYCLDKKGDRIKDVTCEDTVTCNDGFLKFMNPEDCEKIGKRLN